jgi:hypothetical protein
MTTMRRVVRSATAAKVLAAVLSTALTAVLAACTSGTSTAPTIARGVAYTEPAASPAPYGAADTAFGLDVLRTWCQADPDANLVFSPAVLAAALGMAYLGAKGPRWPPCCTCPPSPVTRCWPGSRRGWRRCAR